MPLKKSKSKQAFSQNVSAEMHAGKPMKQSLAIAYSVKRKAKKMAKGGEVEPSEHPDFKEQELMDSDMEPQAEWHEQNLMEVDPDLFIDEPYDLEEGNADQDAARESVLSKVMRKHRR